MKTPNTYVIIFSVLLLCAVATWFIPGGVPQTWQVFSALFEGFSQQAGIIAFVLIIGGAFWVVNSTKAVDAGITRFIAKASTLERFSLVRKLGIGNIVIVLVMLLFGVFGAVFGMSEETIAFVAVVIPLAKSLGYDEIVGVCMVYVAAHVGFAGAMLNPFTVGIAQEMSGLALFSGIEYRTICWAVLMTIAIICVLLYAAKVKRTTSTSLQCASAPGSSPASSAAGSYPASSDSGSCPVSSAFGSYPESSAAGSYAASSFADSYAASSFADSYAASSPSGSYPESSAAGDAPVSLSPSATAEPAGSVEAVHANSSATAEPTSSASGSYAASSDAGDAPVSSSPSGTAEPAGSVETVHANSSGTAEPTGSVETVSETKAGIGAWTSFVAILAALILFSAFYASECVIKVGQGEFAAPWLMWVADALFVIFSLVSLRSSTQMYILNLLMFTILFMVVGVMGYGWYLPEICALFMALGIAAGVASGNSADSIAKEFIAGAKDIFSAALIIGFAAGIIYILKNGNAIDPMLNSMAQALEGAGKTGALGMMYGIQTFLNLFIPSASAKAAVTMPIMAPFSDMIGLSRQATVLSFQFGDGFTNMITPCSGVLMAVLSVARIPYANWFKWIWKFILLLLAVGFLLLLPAALLEMPGF